ncbi:Mad22 [Candidatus Magnetomoraceae bacterium gMMP-15]
MGFCPIKTEKFNGKNMMNLKRKEVVEYAEHLSSYLRAKKKREILSSAIAKNKKEINYIRCKLENIKKHKEQTGECIQEIKPEFDSIQKSYKLMEKDKQLIEAEYEALSEIYKENEQKRRIIHEKKFDIQQLSEKVRILSQEYQIAVDQYINIQKEKAEITDEINEKSETIPQIKNNIEIIKITLDMMKGKMPELASVEELTHLKRDDQKVIVEEYVNDVQKTMDQISNEVSEIKANINASIEKSKKLNAEEKALTQRLKKLSNYISEENNLDLLRTEVTELEITYNQMSKDIDQRNAEIENLVISSNELKENLAKEKSIENEILEEYNYLKEHKQKIDQIDDIDSEIKRIQSQIEDFVVKTEIQKKIYQLTEEIKTQAHKVHEPFQQAYESYAELLKNFDKIVLSLPLREI